MSESNKREIFVIHGRNLKIRDSIFDFLRNLDLHPISFEEAKQKTGKGSPYILEILNKAINENPFIIALFTPDDIAFLNPFFHSHNDNDNEKRPMGQSRQNVIFETGMAFAINPDRTILIFFGEIREFSDISGLHYIKFEDTPEKRNELKDLLSSIGCPIRESSKYLSVGDFNLDTEILQNIIRTLNYSSIKNDIINSIKNLRALSIKIVRNEYNEEIDKNFRSSLKFVSNFPEVSAILPSYISQETDAYYLHKYFKEQGGYRERVQKIGSDFDKSLQNIKNLNF